MNQSNFLKASKYCRTEDSIAHGGLQVARQEGLDAATSSGGPSALDGMIAYLSTCTWVGHMNIGGSNGNKDVGKGRQARML